ncbi:MAG: DUF1552 domain-containing protein [Isosphaeraceae bacterium]|nr:DUF1552 domain-containing protein [Isosphaeraceae bacterium]
MSTQRLSRRTVLRGLGTALALPWLDAMAPAANIAKGKSVKAAAKRMAFFYVPNGVNMADWTPSEVGTNFTLPEVLKVLEPYKSDTLVISGLAQDGAFAHGDGGGDHARSLACFLTGRHPLKTDGANIRAGVSVDQVAAQQIGHLTRLPSLELGCDRGAQSGNCDSGYSCAYSSNISWRSETTPMAKEVNPRQVFERLFSNNDPNETPASRAKRDRYRKSILDFVAEDADVLKRRLGQTDRRKLDEYLTAVRELEVRIGKASELGLASASGFSKPQGVPQDFKEHIRLMFDLLAIAFQGDVTRIATFMYANEGSNKSYSFIGVPEGHHDLSHHSGNDEKKQKIKQINKFHMEQFVYFLAKLKATREGEGTLLDHSMILYGSGISDGNSHSHKDLPIVLVGKGGGSIPTGRHVKLESQTPLNNLFLSMLDRIGAPADQLGDSTGRLMGL